jgi:hypothetical protein
MLQIRVRYKGFSFQDVGFILSVQPEIHLSKSGQFEKKESMVSVAK